MIGKEEGVAVVRNNSNNEQTPYISLKETLNPTTEYCTDQPYSQQWETNYNNKDPIRKPLSAKKLLFQIHHTQPIKYP